MPKKTPSSSSDRSLSLLQEENDERLSHCERMPNGILAGDGCDDVVVAGDIDVGSGSAGRPTGWENSVYKKMARQAQERPKQQ